MAPRPRRPSPGLGVAIVRALKRRGDRFADEHDLPALSERVEQVEGVERGSRGTELAHLLDHGLTLILPADDGGVAGSAHVEIEGDAGHVDFLVVAPEADTGATERRLLAVADAVCEAYHCRTVDVLGRVPRRRARVA